MRADHFDRRISVSCEVRSARKMLGTNSAKSIIPAVFCRLQNRGGGLKCIRDGPEVHPLARFCNLLGNRVDNYVCQIYPSSQLATFSSESLYMNETIDFIVEQ